MQHRFHSISIAFTLVFAAFSASATAADSSVERNSNVIGSTPAGQYRGIPAMQDNEPSCAINPILPRNIVCAWNASGGSDDLIGDTWIRFSESIDGGRTFFNGYLNGSALDPQNNIGQEFAADPVMMCWPGGCGTVMLASSRGENGGEGGGIFMQLMADFNTETGFRKALKVNLDQIYRSTGSKFADKPHATFVLDREDPGVVEVTMEVSKPSGGTEFVTRAWPKGRIIVVFALFNPSKNDIEILSTQTDNYGLTWSNPKQIAQTSGRDQGVGIAAIGDTVFYGFRRFANGTESDAMMGVVATRQGTRVSKPFEIDAPLCAYDVPTLPNEINTSAAAARTNDFPWVSQNGSNFIMVYSRRLLSSDGGCLSNLNERSDSRIVAVVGSGNGKNWSDPVEVAPNADHGFQFMPTVDCSLGFCQIAWWDTRRDSQRTRDFLQNGTPAQQAALVAFENLPIFADFQFPTGNGSELIQFKRTADMYTKKFELANNNLVTTPDEPVRASQYQLGLFNGELVEREVNPFHVKAYKSNTVPFAGDYNSITSVKHRFVFDPEDPTASPYWEENAGPNPLDPDAEPLFWLSWTDGRNMRGQLYTSSIAGKPPYARTPAASMVVDNGDATGDAAVERDPRRALSVEDSNPGAMTCVATPALPPGTYFEAINNRTKDADIYGALIEGRINAWSLNPTKTLGNIQRTYTIVGENDSDLARRFRFEIVNQPVGFPNTARASWDQLPYEITDPTFPTTIPDAVEFEDVGPRSSVSVALFLVSAAPVNPVAVSVYDDTTGELINTLIVNGSIESGPLLNPNGTINDFELHNPVVYAPDQFNPDQYNPDQYNPDQFNPDLYNPDQFNPDQFNPDQFNPDQYNPDQFNPDQFNPDQFNPDQFNPDQFNPDQYNPDQFNSTLTDSETLDNPEIPKPGPILDPNTGAPVDLVVRLDVNFGIENVGNTLTPYSVDFALADNEVLEMIENQEIATQLIAWQDKQISDVQFCEPVLVTENRVIAVRNNPDLTQLNIPDIDNNRVGALTYFVAPRDILQNTLRFIGPRSRIDIVATALQRDIISYVFASQAANTNEVDLGIDREQVINDRTPAQFNRVNGDVAAFEATGPTGALIPTDLVTASKGTEIIAPLCTPALGAVVGLDIKNVPEGPMSLVCTATSSNDVTATLSMFISVLDTMAPTIDPLSIPADIVVEASSADGAIVHFGTPTAIDSDSVDPSVDVACNPASGSQFAFNAPGPTTTTVTCTATDDSFNSSSALFDVTVQDTSAPVIDDISPPIFDQSEPFVLGADASTFRLQWGPFGVDDPDPNLDVSCNIGVLDVSQPLYTFVYEFSAGTTTVVCTATDSSGNTASGTFDVTVLDKTGPEITLLGDAVVTLELGSDSYVDAGATAIDNADGDVASSIAIDADSVDTNQVGSYIVTISASDSSGNVSRVTRTVIVEFAYGGSTGVIPAKTSVKLGSSNPLTWAWLDGNGSPVDSSGDRQLLSIRNCSSGVIVLETAGDSGESGFRYKSDNYWQFNWETDGERGERYCAVVESSLSGQTQGSPPIRLR